MSGLGIRPRHRIRGRAALERRLRGVLIALHRFGRARATTARDVLWAGRALDAITDLLPENTDDHDNTPTTRT